MSHEKRPIPKNTSKQEKLSRRDDEDQPVVRVGRLLLPSKEANQPHKGNKNIIAVLAVQVQ